MLVEQSTSPSSGRIRVDIDPFNVDKFSFHPYIQVYKTWETGRDADGKIMAVWAGCTIKLNTGEFPLKLAGDVHRAFDEAVTQAARLDREYPPGMPVAEAKEEGT